MKETCELCRLLEDPESICGGTLLETDHFAVIHHQPPVDVEGWLIAVPKRHVESQSDLNDIELAELVSLEKKLTLLLEKNFHAERVYRVCFSEIVRHIHFHLIPRTADVPAHRRGPGIFSRDEGNLLAEKQIRKLNDRMREFLK